MLAILPIYTDTDTDTEVAACIIYSNTIEQYSRVIQVILEMGNLGINWVV